MSWQALIQRTAPAGFSKEHPAGACRIYRETQLS